MSRRTRRIWENKRIAEEAFSNAFASQFLSWLRNNGSRDEERQANYKIRQTNSAFSVSPSSFVNLHLTMPISPEVSRCNPCLITYYGARDVSRGLSPITRDQFRSTLLRVLRPPLHASTPALCRRSFSLSRHFSQRFATPWPQILPVAAPLSRRSFGGPAVVKP